MDCVCIIVVLSVVRSPLFVSSFSGDDDDDVNACEDRYDSMGYGDESEYWVDEEY